MRRSTALLHLGSLTASSSVKRNSDWHVIYPSLLSIPPIFLPSLLLDCNPLKISAYTPLSSARTQGGSSTGPPLPSRFPPTTSTGPLLDIDIAGVHLYVNGLKSRASQRGSASLPRDFGTARTPSHPTMPRTSPVSGETIMWWSWRSGCARTKGLLSSLLLTPPLLSFTLQPSFRFRGP